MVVLGERPITLPRRRPLDVVRGRWWLLAVAIFALTRIVDALMILAAGRDQPALIAHAGLHMEQNSEAAPDYWTLLTNWDGQWYWTIAEHGYPSELPRDASGTVEQNPYAFFPLYPALVRLFMVITRLPFPVAASVVSMAAGAVAMVLLFRMLERTGTRFGAVLAVAALCCFPAAVVFQAAYTESLALLLIVLSLSLLQQRRYGWLMVVSICLALTRPIAFALAIVVAVHWLGRWSRRDEEPFPGRERAWCAVAAVAAALEFGLWPLVTAVLAGEPKAYLLTQQAWLVSGDSRWASWLGALASSHSRGVGILALVVLTAVLVLVLQPRARQWPLEWRAWAPAYLLFILAVAPPATSGIRYLMLTVIPWWPVALTSADRLPRSFKVGLLVGLLLVGFLGQWWWIRGFLVFSRHVTGYP